MGIIPHESSDVIRSVYTEHVQYLAQKICVLYFHSQNLYFTGAQNMFFLYIEFKIYMAWIIKKLSWNGVCLCDKVFLIVSSVISIGFIVWKKILQNIFYGVCSVFYNQNLYFME